MPQEAIVPEGGTLAQRLRARMEDDGAYVFFMAHIVRGTVTRRVAVVDMELPEFRSWVEALTPEEFQQTKVAIEYEGGTGLARVCEIHPLPQ